MQRFIIERLPAPVAVPANADTAGTATARARRLRLIKAAGTRRKLAACEIYSPWTAKHSLYK